MPTARCLLVCLLTVTLACGRVGQSPAEPVAPTSPKAIEPLARLAALELDLADADWHATCQVEVTTPEGDLVARLDEESRVRVAADGSFDVELVHRFDNRYQRGAVDSMRAVLAAGVLAARRQGEPFARVANLHGESTRYREVGLGLFPALVSGFTAEAPRAGDRLQLVAVSPAAPTPGDQRPAANDRDWIPAFRGALSNVSGQGSLVWPAGAGRPTGGTLRVAAALNGHAFRAECALSVASLAAADRPRLPSPLVTLERPRVQRDLEVFLRRLPATGAADPR